MDIILKEKLSAKFRIILQTQYTPLPFMRGYSQSVLGTKRQSDSILQAYSESSSGKTSESKVSHVCSIAAL